MLLLLSACRYLQYLPLALLLVWCFVSDTVTLVTTHLTHTCLKQKIKALETSVKYMQS